MLNLEQAAEFLNRNADEVRKLAVAGELPGIKSDNKWSFDEADLFDWATNHPKQSYKLDITDEDLLKLAETHSNVEIANMCDVTPTAIGYRLHLLGVYRNRRS